ncbi:MAG TPA: dynamin family protein [Acidimicrobiales bacterium]|nr:dynamin family protein [Acidimicrobiales bacterium]
MTAPPDGEAPGAATVIGSPAPEAHGSTGSGADRSAEAGVAERQALQVIALLERLGQAQRGVAVAAELERPESTTPVVVVAGEDKRGKSSLINALLGRPDVSPVGLEVVTSAPVTFHFSERDEAEVFWYGSEQPTSMGVGQACELATVDGAAATEQSVSAVRVGLPSPILAGMDLVDTPGVGGLESGHATLTLQSLGQADALVFVLEAGAQIRGPELAFLRKAAARIESVVLVVTKVDRYRGWRTIMADNMVILTEQAPRFARCPVVPVSAVLALRGLRSADPSDAAAMEEESGITLLASTLGTKVVDRRSALADANVARAGLSALFAAEQALAGRLQALSPNEDARRALRAEQERLARLQDDKANWPRVLDIEVRKLTIDQGDELARGTTDIKRRYQARISKATTKDEKTLPGELSADLVALAGQLGESAAGRLSAIVAQLLAEVDADEGLESSLENLTRGALETDVARLELSSRPFGISERLSVLSGFSSGHSLATLMVGSSGLLTAGILSGPFAILFGLGFGGFYAFANFRSKRKQLLASELTTWMNDQCQEAQRAIKTNFSRAIIDIQEEIKSRIKAALAECEADVSHALAAAKEVLYAGESARQRDRAEIEGNLAEIRSLKAEAVKLLGALGTGPLVAGPMVAGPAVAGPAVAGPVASEPTVVGRVHSEPTEVTPISDEPTLDEPAAPSGGSSSPL